MGERRRNPVAPLCAVKSGINKMKTSRVLASLGIVLSVALLSGCDSKAHFSQAEIDAIKDHKHTEMPPGAAEANAKRMKEAGNLYQQRLKEAGLLGPNGMRQGDGPAGGPPPGATPGGPPPGATPGGSPAASGAGH